MIQHYRLLARAAAIASVIALGLPSALTAEQGRGRGAADKPAKAEKRAEKQADKADQKAAKADRKDDRKAARNVPAKVVVIDRDGHARAIRDYTRGGTLPPGLAKRESLPPGLRKQLRERGTLPPGLQRHLVIVEGPLVTRLPAVPDYYRRYFAGDDLIIVDTRTNRIVTIIRDIWG